MADLLCCLIAAIPSGNKTHPAAELEAGHQEFELVVRKPTPDAELGFVMTVGASPKVGSLSPDGLAASAGLHIGDRIRKVNEARVDTDDTALLAIRNAQTQRPNDPVTLTVSRYMSKGPLVLREVTLPSGALGVVFETGSTKVKELREGSALRGLVHPGERIVAFAHAGGRVDCTSGWESTDAGLAALLNTHKDEPGRRLTVRGNAAHSGAQPASMLRHFLS